MQRLSPTASTRAALHDALRSPNIRAALLRAAGRHLSNVADAEDCVQEACIAAVLRVDQLREPELVRSWLTTIVVNACRMRVRAERGLRRGGALTKLTAELREVRDPGRDVDDRLHALRVLSDIRARVRRHDERDLRVVDALLDEDAGYEVLARRCEMTTSAFKTRVSRLRKRLRKAGIADAA